MGQGIPRSLRTCAAAARSVPGSPRNSVTDTLSMRLHEDEEGTGDDAWHQRRQGDAPQERAAARRPAWSMLPRGWVETLRYDRDVRYISGANTTMCPMTDTRSDGRTPRQLIDHQCRQADRRGWAVPRAPAATARARRPTRGRGARHRRGRRERRSARAAQRRQRGDLQRIERRRCESGAGPDRVDQRLVPAQRIALRREAQRRPSVNDIMHRDDDWARPCRSRRTRRSEPRRARTGGQAPFDAGQA